MSSYYYLVATLPMLHYDGAAPFDCKTFLGLCKWNVSDGDYQLLLAALSDRPSRNALLARWQDYRKMVDRELCEQRSLKLGLSATTYRNTGSKDLATVELVKKAVANDNVLEAELSLMKASWNYLDELAVMHDLDIEGLLAYAIKLRLLQRKGLFVQEAGNAEFKRLFSNLQSDIENI